MNRLLGPPPAVDWWSFSFALVATLLAVHEFRRERYLWTAAFALIAAHNAAQVVGLA